jgi:hypothetical protein
MHLIACFPNLHCEISNIMATPLSGCLLFYVLIFVNDIVVVID